MSDSAVLRVAGLVKAFGARRVLHAIDLTIREPELVCVLGPSGSGKTTLLRCIAGLEPAAGQIEVAGVAVHPGDRPRSAMVFQRDVLFPELTVAQNIGFGLRAAELEPELAADAVAATVLQLGLSGLEDRYPDELSGGQQRRVVLARALVLRRPLLLLDEPLAGLDEALAAEGAQLIRATQRRLGVAMVLVTHDQSAALAMADRIVVLHNGRIAQQGPPRQVFDRPDSAFVAQFIGRSAFLEAVVDRVRASADGPVARVGLLGAVVDLPAHPKVLPGPAIVLVRPHALTARVAEVTAEPWAEPIGNLGVVEQVRYLGERMEYSVETEHGSVIATGDLDEPPLRVNQVATLTLTASRAWVLPAP
ncbi:ABC transporter ATP-binding protein [Micropruina sp.]|uniref:ABC transporter ATP-binding protein n=1 Tax=Micropruina sp. TaxID=2737536 RepID=UPI0039E3F673